MPSELGEFNSWSHLKRGFWRSRCIILPGVSWSIVTVSFLIWFLWLWSWFYIIRYNTPVLSWLFIGTVVELYWLQVKLFVLTIYFDYGASALPESRMVSMPYSVSLMFIETYILSRCVFRWLDRLSLIDICLPFITFYCIANLIELSLVGCYFLVPLSSLSWRNIFLLVSKRSTFIYNELVDSALALGSKGVRVVYMK